MPKTTDCSYFAQARAALGILSLGVLLAACGGSDSEGQESAQSVSQPDVVVSPNDSRQYQTLTLDNGIEVLLVSDPAVEKSAAALSVGVGLLFDPMAYQGMAHYLEHMLFLGTQKYPESDGYMAFIQENGGANNAYTWLDITNYMFEVKNSAYDSAIDRFAHFFKTPLLDPEYIEKEKSAVNAEWSMRREMDFFGMYKLSRSLMGEHPANRFLIGNLETLADEQDSTLHEATKAFYAQYYSANLMKVAMVSDRSLPEMAALAEANFGDIVNKNIPAPKVTTAIDFEQAAGKLIHYVPQEDQRMVQIDFIIDGNVDEFRVKPNQYLSYIMGSEMPNTPATVLKGLGWASSLMVSSEADQFGNYGVFSISVDLTEAGMAHRDTIVNMLFGYIDQLKAEGVDDRYAAEFKTSLDNQFQFLEKVNDFAYVSQLAGAMQDYPSKHAIDAPFRFEGFDKAAVDRVLNQLTPERAQVWYVSKDEPADQAMHFYSGKYRVKPLAVAPSSQRLALVEQYGLAMPALNTLLPESFAVAHASAQPTRVIEEPGLEIWLQGSDVYREQPKGFTQIYLNTASREAGPASVVLQSLWTDLYNLRQATLFTEASIAGMNASVSGSHGLKLNFSGFTDKQDELVAKALAALRFTPTEDELAQAIDRFKRGLENSKRSFPVRQLRPALNRLTMSGNYSEQALLDALQGLTVASFSNYVNDELTKAYVRAYLFGNYSADTAGNLAAVINEALPNRSGEEYIRPAMYAPQPGKSVVLQQDLPVEDLGMIYLFAAPEASVENIARGEVLGAHLANRAFNRLRTEEQLGYAAGGLATLVGDHPFLGFYIQTPVKAPVAMLERFEAFKQEYQANLAELTAEEFERIKAGVLTNLTEPPKNLSEEARPFVADWIKERYNFNSRAKLIAAVEAVSIDDIRAYYNATVMAEMPSKVLVQLRGRAFANEPFAEIEGATVVDDIASFHKVMATQP